MGNFKRNLQRDLFCISLLVSFESHSKELDEFNKKLAKEVETQGIEAKAKAILERQDLELSKLVGLKKPTLIQAQSLVDPLSQSLRDYPIYLKLNDNHSSVFSDLTLFNSAVSKGS